MFSLRKTRDDAPSGQPGFRGVETRPAHRPREVLSAAKSTAEKEGHDFVWSFWIADAQMASRALLLESEVSDVRTNGTVETGPLVDAIAHDSHLPRYDLIRCNVSRVYPGY